MRASGAVGLAMKGTASVRADSRPGSRRYMLTTLKECYGEAAVLHNHVQDPGPPHDTNVGTKLRAFCEDEGEWYPATVEQDFGNGVFEVRWDDPQSGPEFAVCGIEYLRELFTYERYYVGDAVRAIFPEDGAWYNGTVVDIRDDVTYDVAWDDPDGGPEISTCRRECMDFVQVFKDFGIGDRVEALFSEDGKWYFGTVEAKYGDGIFRVAWESVSDEPRTSDCNARYMKAAPIYSDYQVGDWVEVRCARSGKWRQGVIGHALPTGFRVRWQDIDQVGIEETVWCQAADIRGVFRDYCIGDHVEARFPVDGEWYEGSVVKVLEYGAFEVKWKDAAYGPSTSMCAAEEMVRLEREHDTMDWYDDTEWTEDFLLDDSSDAGNFQDDEYWDSEGADTVDEWPQHAIDACLPGVHDLLVTSSQSPWPSCTRPTRNTAKLHASEDVIVQYLWSKMASRPPCLTLNPTCRGQRRDWRFRSCSMFLGRTVQRRSPFGRAR